MLHRNGSGEIRLARLLTTEDGLEIGIS